MTVTRRKEDYTETNTDINDEEQSGIKLRLIQHQGISDLHAQNVKNY